MSIQIKNLSKKYENNKFKSLDNVNLKISNGIFGLIGENGAGKTTLLKTLATQLKVESGEVNVFEYELPKDTQKVRSILGYLPQDIDFFNHLTVFEMLDYIGLLKNIKEEEERKKQIDKLLLQFNLSEKRNTQVSSLSGGMKQRLGIAQCLLGDSKLIILDEPTVGLDPIERLRFRNIINEIAKDKIIIVSTHIISDIAMMCENLAIIKKGKILYSGSTDELLEKLGDKVCVDIVDSNIEINDAKYKQIISITRKKGKLEVRFIEETNNTYQHVEPTLEDAYFYMANKELE